MLTVLTDKEGIRLFEIPLFGVGVVEFQIVLRDRHRRLHGFSRFGKYLFEALQQLHGVIARRTGVDLNDGFTVALAGIFYAERDVNRLTAILRFDICILEIGIRQPEAEGIRRRFVF